MEDWQEMAIIVAIVLLAMTAYLIYIGVQLASLRNSISGIAGVEQVAGGQGISNPMSPLYWIAGGLGR